MQIAEAVAPIKPLWLEDPLPVDYRDSWKRLVATSPVPICTGENLSRRQASKDFIWNQGCDILNPDLAQPRRLPRNQAHRRHGGPLRPPHVVPTTPPVGHLDGWISSWLLDQPYMEQGHIRVNDRPGYRREVVGLTP